MDSEVIILTMEYFIDFVMVVCGIILCFLGYRFFKAAITCCGLVIGYQIGTFIGNFIGAYTGNPLVYPFPLVLQIVFAIVLGILAFRFYKKAIVTSVAYFVAQFAYKAFIAANPDRINETKDNLILIGICIAIGIAVGLLCMFIQKWAIIVVSAIGGGRLIGIVAAKYLWNVPVVKDTTHWIMTELFKTEVATALAVYGLLVLIFAVLGIVVQAKNTKRM